MMLQLRHDRLSQGTTPSSSSLSSTGGGVHVSSSEDSDSEEEPSDASESELDVDSYYFLQVCKLVKVFPFTVTIMRRSYQCAAFPAGAHKTEESSAARGGCS